MNSKIRSIVIPAVIGCVAGCATTSHAGEELGAHSTVVNAQSPGQEPGAKSPGQDPGAQTNAVKIKLPAKTLVQVVITSESCNHLQTTVITWPDGSKDTFVTAAPASPDSCDDKYDAAHPTIVTYGMMSYQTGPAGSEASVEVFEQEVGKPPVATLTRVQAATRVESEGHRNPIRYDWNDTVVSFTW